MSRYVTIGKDMMEAFCEQRGFQLIKEGYVEGEPVLWVIGADGIQEYYTFSYIRRATQDDFWATEEGMVAGAYEEVNEHCLEERLTITRRP